MRRIAETLGQCVPMCYEEALKMLFSIDESCVGFPYLFFPDFVEVYGQDRRTLGSFNESAGTFYTKVIFGICNKTFYNEDPERVMKHMMIWAKHPNEHVRRLASEGCRPRLPWGMALEIFKRDPAQVLNILKLRVIHLFM